MSEPGQEAADFSPLIPPRIIFTVEVRRAFNCRLSCGNSGLSQKQRFEETHTQTGYYYLSVKASSARLKLSVSLWLQREQIIFTPSGLRNSF